MVPCTAGDHKESTIHIGSYICKEQKYSSGDEQEKHLGNY